MNLPQGDAENPFKSRQFKQTVSPFLNCQKTGHIMNKVKGALPMIAFVFAAFAAFAFSPKQTSSEQWGQDNGVWYNATNMTPEVDYVCDSEIESHCLYDSPDPDRNPITPGEDKTFVKLP